MTSSPPSKYIQFNPLLVSPYKLDILDMREILYLIYTISNNSVSLISTFQLSFTYFNPPFFIEVPVPSHAFSYWRSHINPGNWAVLDLCVTGIDFDTFCDFFWGTVATAWYFLFSILQEQNTYIFFCLPFETLLPPYLFNIILILFLFYIFWNIVESGVQHQNRNPNPTLYFPLMNESKL
jgi:hypothetical protein